MTNKLHLLCIGELHRKQIQESGKSFVFKSQHGAEYRCQWRKLHIGIDTNALKIRAICVTSNNVSDASVLPDLLVQLPPDDALRSLTGDGAYDTQPAYDAVVRHDAIPIIPPRKNARIRKGGCFRGVSKCCHYCV